MWFFHKNLIELCQIWTLKIDGKVAQKFDRTGQVWTFQLEQLFFHKNLTKLSQVWTFKVEEEVSTKI